MSEDWHKSLSFLLEFEKQRRLLVLPGPLNPFELHNQSGFPFESIYSDHLVKEAVIQDGIGHRSSFFGTAKKQNYKNLA